MDSMQPGETLPTSPRRLELVETGCVMQSAGSGIGMTRCLTSDTWVARSYRRSLYVQEKASLTKGRLVPRNGPGIADTEQRMHTAIVLEGVAEVANRSSLCG